MSGSDVRVAARKKGTFKGDGDGGKDGALRFQHPECAGQALRARVVHKPSYVEPVSARAHGEPDANAPREQKPRIMAAWPWLLCWG